MAPSRPRVVVIGAGFAGMHCVRRLRNAAVDVTLVDRSTSHVFQPLLYQCATGLLSEGAISSPIRHLTRRQRNLDVVLGEAADIDVETREVVVDRLDRSSFRLPYDYLVVGTGMRTAYRGNDQFAKYAPGMKTLDDALTIRRKIMAAFEMAETITDPEEQRSWLTFAIAGGGPTGVELAGQIRELATRALEREYDAIDPAHARVLLLHGGDRVLPSFNVRLSASAQRTLDDLGVETHLGVHVTDVGDDYVETTRKADKHKDRYPARTTLWTTGVEAVPFAATLATALGVEQDRAGRISVEADLSVPGHPEVFVAGDMMAYKDLAGVAEVAMQGGHHVGRVIAESAGGQQERSPFKYRDLGTAAYIARRRAIVQSGRFQMSGFPGWVAWGVIHIAFLAGIRNRLGTVMTWGATLLTDSRRERAIIYGDTETARTPYARREAK
ncbi:MULTISPECIES: NAD(P)/FAD-dependent oxidoreductase [Gordonia]|uniref:NADH:ubiquinone reductase (non-electrogenic) n=1 Tax=Gordonia alkanivorans CGMCC 6845 TaxID=1423140 RepID=W9DMQ6_9ACTN|nr:MULTISPECIES: NAD(P)/FAD-dependent oxidoreductase [Gordonia]ETA08835.1 NADH dehydrogenase [Gordonia alkanivorans CGMCC 6845]MDH3005501.1 NAD(P)/FAD-dependent oxidoreductase [Gordonia alkanivorans]MDH3010203.1 NAD(P)/FAD-dependent oxidoreductase [Gordonia alkanivorans]MDH3014913.1 NAD(P)/FAD-dependent oxidoreductase [Gordonia alkanivorans]MDH3019003.1 NAD(P)/FAD-dependent oxidoreductase [Gordonia alkanivorans]